MAPNYIESSGSCARKRTKSESGEENSSGSCARKRIKFEKREDDMQSSGSCARKRTKSESGEENCSGSCARKRTKFEKREDDMLKTLDEGELAIQLYYSLEHESNLRPAKAQAIEGVSKNLFSDPSTPIKKPAAYVLNKHNLLVTGNKMAKTLHKVIRQGQYLISENYDLNSSLKTSNAKANDLKQELAATHEKLREEKAALGVERLTNTHKTSCIKNQAQKMNEMKGEIVAAKSLVSQKDARISTLEGENKSKDARITVLEEDVKRKDIQIGVLEAENTRKGTILKGNESRISSQSTNIVELGQKLVKTRTEFKAMQAASEGKDGTIAEKEELIQKLVTEVAGLKGQVNEQAAELKDLTKGVQESGMAPHAG